MAQLTAEQRAEIRATICRVWSSERETITGLTKPDILAAVQALDTWIDANAASVNAAIPQPARSGLTAAQKARLFWLIAEKRYVEGA